MKLYGENLKGKNKDLVKDKIFERENLPIEKDSNVMWNEMSNIIK